MKPFPLIVSLSLCGILTAPAQSASAPDKYSAASYGSIQEALDRNPGRIITVPDGDFPISQAIVISTNNSGLVGTGRIIQSNPDADIITVNPTVGVRLKGLTLTRAAGKMDTRQGGVVVEACDDFVMDGVQINDNKTRFAAVKISDSVNVKVLNCIVQNYMSVCEEDRTQKDGWGFAFNTVNGTGMDVRATRGALVQGNRLIETEILPTPEIKAKYHLGYFTRKNAVKGILTSQKIWDEGYYPVWHQGSALHVGVPDISDYIQILGNFIENAAQGIDVQGDHVIISQNIVTNSFMGMKAMHGARNLIISGNQFSKNDLWSIGLMPGMASRPALEKGADGKPAVANIDGYSIVSNNIISDFGYGNSWWVWKDGLCVPFRFDTGQIPSNPPLSNVLVLGNVLYDTGADKIMVDGKPQVEPPRYKYAVYVATDKDGPVDMHYNNNILPVGTSGVSNVELKP